MTVRQETARRPRKRKATARMAQGKPTRAISWSSMIGRTTPPSDDPDTMIPSAAARRRKNHDITLLIAPLNAALDPSDANSPCARMNW